MERLWKLNNLLLLLLLAAPAARAEEDISQYDYTPLNSINDERQRNILNDNFNKLWAVQFLKLSDDGTSVYTPFDYHFNVQLPVGSTGPVLVVSTGSTPLLEVNGGSVVVSVPLYFPVPVDEIWVTTTNGYGATNTSVPRFLNVIRTSGTAITYADSSVLGSSFTIHKDGLYFISYGNQFSGSAGHMGVVRNGTHLTAMMQNVPAPERILITLTPGANLGATVGGVFYLRAGDIIRPQDDPQSAGTNRSIEFFRIKRIQ